MADIVDFFLWAIWPPCLFMDSETPNWGIRFQILTYRVNKYKVYHHQDSSSYYSFEVNFAPYNADVVNIVIVIPETYP